ncbi:MAG: hypothetical protein U0X76_05055 [Bacteroidia bacterium]
MKKITQFLYSSKFMVVLLIAVCRYVACRTFIEDKYDTATARALIYNTKWFELIFLLLAINFLGHIPRYHMFRKQRIGGVMFHLAFVIMIIGAGVTRYFRMKEICGFVKARHLILCIAPIHFCVYQSMKKASLLPMIFLSPFLLT